MAGAMNPGHNLRRSIVSLGAVTAFDMAAQVALPMVLVRLLSEMDFGQYRAIWLIAGSALALLPLAVPASLFYFLPRHPGPSERGAWLIQSALLMLLAALVGCLATWLFGASVLTDLRQPGQLAGFIGLWVFGSLLDVVYNAQQRSQRQAAINLAFSLARIALITGAAWVTRTIEGVLAAHLLLGALKAAACAFSILAERAGAAPFSRQRVREQLTYAAPFGISSGLYLLRGRIDQWLVASLFSAAQFGVYSIAAIFVPIQGLVRSTINSVLLPELNRLNASAEPSKMLALNHRGNLAVAMLMFPALLFLGCAASPLLNVLFTADYERAAPVVRVYCLLLMIESIEVTMLLTAFRQGRFMMWLDALMLAISVAVSYWGAQLWGLTGAALGGLTAALVAQTTAYVWCARVMSVPLSGVQQWAKLARVLLAAVISAAFTWAALQFTTELSAGSALLLSAGLFTLLYWLALRLLGLGPLVRELFGDRLAALAAF